MLFQITMLCITGCLGTLYGTLSLTEDLPKGVFFFWICAIYICECGNWVVLPSCTAKLFGVSHMAVNYAFIQIAYVSISNFLFIYPR